MIHREATIKYAGYDPDKLSINSHKRVCVVCEKCGRVRWCAKQQYHDLCKKCSHIKYEDKDIINKIFNKVKILRIIDRTKYIKVECKCKCGKIFITYFNNLITNHTTSCGCYNKERVSETFKGIPKSKETRKKMSEWQKGNKNHNWKGGKSKEWRKYRNAIYLNKKIKNYDRHHLTKSLVIYIPKELHFHIPHNLKTGKNMAKINMLALQFINGGL